MTVTDNTELYEMMPVKRAVLALAVPTVINHIMTKLLKILSPIKAKGNRTIQKQRR